MMLKKSAQFLKIGGYIVYCVCSIHSSEGSNQIETFLRKNKNFKIVEFNNIVSNFGKYLKKGMLQQNLLICLPVIITKIIK